MAIIRNSASALRKGRVGNTTYYVSGQRQIARVSQNSSNYGETARRTEAMQERRARWGNLVNFYKVSKTWMKYAYETKTAKQSDYNRFMQVNLNSTSVYLTKDQAALGACVVEPFAVSQGSLRSISLTKVSSYYVTDIELGNLVIDDDTTVGAFSSQVIAYNNGVRAGFQLSFISYQQWADYNGIPQVTCTPYEVTLDPTSEAKLRNYLPEFCSTTRNYKLGTSLTISAGAFCYMWSVTEVGITRVSSQTLINNNATMISDYSSAAQRQLAMESYGLDVDSFLMSGSLPQIPTPATQSITQVWSSVSGTIYPGGTFNYTLADLSGQAIGILLQRYQIYDDIKVYARVQGNALIPLTYITTSTAGEVRATMGTQSLTNLIVGFELVLDGVTYDINFAAPSAQDEE